MEVYDDIVNFGISYEYMNKNYIEKILKPTLSYNNKTLEDFDNDVYSSYEDQEDNNENQKD